MKDLYSNMALAKLCKWFGITRQAYYKFNKQIVKESVEEELILKEVANIRKLHPRMGTRKLYLKLQDFMNEHQIKKGRDALFNLLANNKMLIKKRKRKVYTTNSFHWLKKYPNLIKNFTPTKPNQVWVSDITYWKINNEKFVYISFITDAFSHKIVGFHVADNLAAIETIMALDMAINELNNKPNELTHHSDRGVQYCSGNYVKKLENNSIKISMTENSDPYENAIAERINGILKDEYLYNYQVDNLFEATNKLKEAVDLYNNDRPHNSVGNYTPNQVHNGDVEPKQLWKNYYKAKIEEQSSAGNSFSLNQIIN